jgi:hypothetical protein
MKNPQKKSQKNKKQKSSPQEYITNWMVSFVEKPHPLLGDMPPCPYAQQARLKGQVKMVWVSAAEPDSNFWTHIENTNFDQTEVLILITDRKRWTWQETYRIRCELNRTFHRDDVVILEDHPDYDEKIGEVHMSNGKYCLLFAQRKSKLNRFADILKKTTDYYKHWSKEEIDDIVTWRYQDLK